MRYFETTYVFIIQKHFLVGIKSKTEICAIIYISQVGGNLGQDNPLQLCLIGRYDWPCNSIRRNK